MSELKSNEEKDKKIIGKISQIIGAVVNVEFPQL